MLAGNRALDNKLVMGYGSSQTLRRSCHFLKLRPEPSPVGISTYPGMGKEDSKFKPLICVSKGTLRGFGGEHAVKAKFMLKMKKTCKVQ